MRSDSDRRGWWLMTGGTIAADRGNEILRAMALAVADSRARWASWSARLGGRRHPTVPASDPSALADVSAVPSASAGPDSGA